MNSILGYNECEVQRKDRIIVLKDKNSGNSKYIANNDNCKMISEFIVDGCIIKDDREKCDFMLLDYDGKKVYFIELKGSDLSKAYSQLVETIRFFKNYEKFQINILKNYKILARIVLIKGNVPNIRYRSYDALVKILEDINSEKIKDGIHIKRIKSGQIENL